MESEAKLPKDEAEDDTLSAGGSVVHSEKVTNHFLTRITKKVEQLAANKILFPQGDKFLQPEATAEGGREG